MRSLLFAAAGLAALSLAACDEGAQDAAVTEEVVVAEDAAPEPVAEEPAAAPAGYAVPAGTPAHIARAVASPERVAAMTDRDALRQPAEMLTIARVQEGDRIAEIAGFGQYFTTLLAEAVGPEGHVYVYDLPYTEERAGEASRAFDEAHENSEYTLVDYNDIALPSDLDAVHIVLYYHDLSLNDVDLAVFNQKVFDALRPGGIYFIVDHNAPDGTGREHTETVHRIDPQVIRDEVGAAGFTLVEESDLLDNPEDTKTGPVFGDGVRGTTDQTIFVFQKPE